ncbi:amidohydrolase family protein [Ammoniphilus sp. CFH 90114]|uniref:N-acyl-D-amino-acid deacylase family protein n=1 Tax=Ammoniphilus sp. CFH 90114 TaxID=2493665 RepID=UPI00100DBD40|nr:D-aminoacylase [Ammoniphilus sp. CFH 90114]RXT02779.1 D-aminoacylase [Ammoniphilus sp. CFH 90114]
MFDILIRGGMVCDGTGNPWTRLDVGIQNGRIASLSDLTDAQGKLELDAKGLVVSPGFIDPHVHSDLLCIKPEVHKIKVLQGVTTELFGQDGISVAPVSEATKPLWQKQLKGLNGDIGDWPWNTVDEYLSFLENNKMCGNSAYLVPHGAVRTLVMGFEGREATKQEIQQMRELVEEGMKQGAFGVSSGIQYPPCVYSNREELVEICKGAAKYDGCFVVHIRNESNLSLEALDEVIDVARLSGVRLHVSHFKVCGSINRDKLGPALAKLEAGRAEGIEITFDQYPYTAASTVFQAILPPWMHNGGTVEMLERLKDPNVRERVKHELLHNAEYDNTVRNNGWGNIVIASVASEKNREFEGHNLVEIGKMRGVEPAEAAFDLLIEENAVVTMIIHWGVEEDVMDVMKHPLQMVGSDGVFGGKPHPRLYGSFPRVLGRYAREKEAFPIWEAVRKMTSAPAQLLRLHDRGILREGNWADITVFDPQTVIDRATYENPLQLAIGIHHVLVNGEIAVLNHEYTGITAGKVIRRGRKEGQ